MEQKRNKHRFCGIILFWGVSLLCSCQRHSYMDLLTGGDVKYWGINTQNYISVDECTQRFSQNYISFNKHTHRRLYYDENLRISYTNGFEYLIKGQYFKIDGNKIYTSWATPTDTFALDTFIIMSISKKRVVMFHKGSCQPLELTHYPVSKKTLSQVNRQDSL